MAEIIAIIAMLCAASALIAWIEFISRNIDAALDEAVGKDSPAAGTRGGERSKRQLGLGTHETRPYRTLDKRTFNR